jgi:exportin-1
VLNELRQKPTAWTRVDTALELSGSVNTKMLALSILDETIRYRWKSLPLEQQQGIRSYIVRKIVMVRATRCVRCV